MKRRIYLDNCCFNRPYDDQSQLMVRLETLAKLQIQSRVADGTLDLVWSYVQKYENSRNPFEAKRRAIARWEQLSAAFVEESEAIVAAATRIAATGVKATDALHVACAIEGGCGHFITTDKRLLKYRDERVVVCSPIEFINLTEI